MPREISTFGSKQWNKLQGWFHKQSTKYLVQCQDSDDAELTKIVLEVIGLRPSNTLATCLLASIRTYYLHQPPQGRDECHEKVKNRSTRKRSKPVATDTQPTGTRATAPSSPPEGHDASPAEQESS